MEIHVPTTMDAWKTVLSELIEKGRNFHDKEGRKGKELDNVLVVIDNPELDVEEPIDYLRGITKWTYPSKQELSEIIFNKEQSMYAFTYGGRIFGYSGIDQINSYVIPLLQQNPSTRRGVVTLGKPQEDTVGKMIPSILNLHFRIVEGKVCLTIMIRSNDYFIGFPANSFQMVAIQTYVANTLNLRPGSLSVFSISANIFDEYEKDITEVLEK